jgi:hypothetical protein
MPVNPLTNKLRVRVITYRFSLRLCVFAREQSAALGHPPRLTTPQSSWLRLKQNRAYAIRPYHRRPPTRPSASLPWERATRATPLFNVLQVRAITYRFSLRLCVFAREHSAALRHLTRLNHSATSAPPRETKPGVCHTPLPSPSTNTAIRVHCRGRG